MTRSLESKLEQAQLEAGAAVRRADQLRLELDRSRRDIAELNVELRALRRMIVDVEAERDRALERWRSVGERSEKFRDRMLRLDVAFRVLKRLLGRASGSHREPRELSASADESLPART